VGSNDSNTGAIINRAGNEGHPQRYVRLLHTRCLCIDKALAILLVFPRLHVKDADCS
jgi:hypothetical protein